MFAFASFVFSVNVTTTFTESSFSVSKRVESKTASRLTSERVFQYQNIRDLKPMRVGCAFPDTHELNMKAVLEFRMPTHAINLYRVRQLF